MKYEEDGIDALGSFLGLIGRIVLIVAFIGLLAWGIAQ